MGVNVDPSLVCRLGRQKGKMDASHGAVLRHGTDAREPNHWASHPKIRRPPTLEYYHQIAHAAVIFTDGVSNIPYFWAQKWAFIGRSSCKLKKTGKLAKRECEC